MKKALFALAALLPLALPAAPARAGMENAVGEPALNLLAWEDYVDYDAVIRPFEEETGIRVRYDAFADGWETVEALSAPGGAAYDVVFAGDYALNAAREAGLMQRLDKALIPNWANLDGALLGQFYDPESAYVMPYIAGGPLIVYDPARVGAAISGFDGLLAPSLRNGVGLVDDARVTVGMALRSIGRSLNDADADALALAGEKLAALAPNVRALGYEDLHERLLSGELAAACLYTPFAALALELDPGLEAIYPEEGVGLGVDGCFIPANAPHARNANLFLDFLLRPETGASIARRHYSYSPNVPARALLGDWYAGNAALAGLAGRLGDAEYLLDLAPEDERRFEDVWARFKQSLLRN